jgi:hypothetical protein
VEQLFQLQPQTVQILFYPQSHQLAAVLVEVLQHRAAETAKTAARVVVVAKAIHRSEQVHPVKAATAAHRTLLAVAVAAVQVQPEQTALQAIRALAAMALRQVLQDHRLLMLVAVVVALMAHTLEV